MWKNKSHSMRNSIATQMNSSEERTTTRTSENTRMQGHAMTGTIHSNFIYNSRLADKNVTLEKAIHEALAAKGTVSLERYLDIPTYLRRGLSINP